MVEGVIDGILFKYDEGKIYRWKTTDLINDGWNVKKEYEITTPRWEIVRQYLSNGEMRIRGLFENRNQFVADVKCVVYKLLHNPSYEEKNYYEYRNGTRNFIDRQDIQHIDGNKTNNTIENLRLRNQADDDAEMALIEEELGIN